MIRIHFKRCVAYRSSWIEGNILYIQMDLCAGSLQNILDIKHQAFGRDFNESMNCIEYQFWCEIFRDILDAVRELHKLNPPIIHRDLKPDNILIKSYIAYDCSDSIKLSDFGLATVHDRAIHEMVDYKHSGGVGTLVYEAPEVRAGRVYTHTADIYSLAIIAEKMFDLDLCELCEPQYSIDTYFS
jgi:serine/threonine protein kinase